ncbi:MAG: cysteine desulfurase [Cytophagales bacterium]|nr:cysteine desulfurase [Cytophagales bacterium]
MNPVQTPVFDVQSIRDDFPIFKAHPELIYLDSAATAQKPKQVIDRIIQFYSTENANIHRGIYDLSHQATQAYENARLTVANFIQAESSNCIAFTKGTTESVNIVAESWLKKQLDASSNVVISLMEHHANLIPWQQVCKDTGAELRVIPLTSEGHLDYEKLPELIDEKTELVAITHLSNTLGTLTDLDKINAIIQPLAVPLLIDAAQSAALHDLNIDELNCDFLTFSGHKTFGPMGIGILYAKPTRHAEIAPFQVGGGIVQEVTIDETSFQEYPTMLEAGTPNVAGVLGLEAAIHYIESLDLQGARQHLETLSQKAFALLQSIEGVTILSPEPITHGILSINIDEVHPHDVASFLNSSHIAVRAGMHCTQPLLEHLEQPATVRVSLSIYNTEKEIEQLGASLKEIVDFWKN